MSDWNSLERPGYLGSHRDEMHEQWNQRFGAGNWRLAWEINRRFFDIDGALLLYEDAYSDFLANN